MKKIFTFSIIALLLVTIFTRCVKQVPFNEAYWLAKEEGQVVYSSSTCPYYLVETANGYSVIRSVSYRPYEGDIVYGDFSYFGLKDIYDRTDASVVSGDVKEYWLTSAGAQDAVNYYCY